MSSSTTQLIFMGLIILVVGFNIYQQYQSGKQVLLTPPAILEAVNAAKPVVAQLMEISQIAVNAVEEARRQGKINSNDQAFNHALNLVKQWIPDNLEVDNATIIETINAAILVASALRSQTETGEPSVKTLP